MQAVIWLTGQVRTGADGSLSSGSGRITAELQAFDEPTAEEPGSSPWTHAVRMALPEGMVEATSATYGLTFVDANLNSATYMGEASGFQLEEVVYQPLLAASQPDPVPLAALADESLQVGKPRSRRVQGADRFTDRLLASAQRAGSWLCVGLDPDPEAFPDGMGPEDTLEFCLGIVEATAEVACCVKPNAAFFEALGEVGEDALRGLVESVPPGIPVLLDGKRNDIGNTARKYAEAAFDELGADAVTVTPYLGRDTVEPFARYADKGVFLLARTSNASAGDFQDLDVGGMKLYQAVARKAMEWNKEFGNLGLVAGATYPDELAQLRAACGDGVPLLIPGVGAQGGDARASLQRGGDAKGRFAVVNVGRAILKAGDGPDWREKAGAAARKFAAELPFQ